MTETINIRGINFASVDMNDAMAICRELAEKEECSVIHTPNSEIVQLCIDDNRYYDIINSADLIVPDGAGVILASKILSTPLKKGKVAGIELCENLIKLAAEKGYSVFFLGGKKGVASLAAQKMKEKYPKLIVSGTHNGYFDKCDSFEKLEMAKKGELTEEDTAVINEINNSGTDILLVCLGVPKQELWMNAHRKRLNIRICGGFGGSFDIYAGISKRAPKIFINLRLEWFYRLIKEPKRIGRMMNLPRFIFSCIGTRLGF